MTKILTREEWLTYLDTTWKKCLAEAWQKEWDDMTRDDIIGMALKAGILWSPDSAPTLERFTALIEAAKEAEFAERLRTDVHSCGPKCQRVVCVAAREAVQAEREACAKVCEDEFDRWIDKNDDGAVAVKGCATAIRARGDT